jgi:hypothetical protein
MPVSGHPQGMRIGILRVAGLGRTHVVITAQLEVVGVAEAFADLVRFVIVHSNPGMARVVPDIERIQDGMGVIVASADLVGNRVRRKLITIIWISSPSPHIRDFRSGIALSVMMPVPPRIQIHRHRFTVSSPRSSKRKVLS